jgi:pheromone shutdown-related protein TraB
MGLREKLRVTWHLLEAITGVYEEELEDVDIESLLKEDALTAVMDELGKLAPSVKAVLVDERDAFIAKKILQASRDGKVLAVVGAGHLKGISATLERGGPFPTYDELNALPVKRVGVGAVLGWSVPVLFLAWTFYMMLTGQFEALGEGFLYWFLITGVAAAIGAAIALAHPLSILTAFCVAWFTTLSPTLAAGWFAGLVEAKMRKPTMADLERIDSTSVRGFLSNKVVRVLMVTALANVTTTIGVVYALPHLLGAG